MARKVFFIVSLVVLIGFFIFYTAYIDRACEAIIDECDACISDLKNDDFTSANQRVEGLLKTWEDYAPRFGFLISNTTIDTIHMTLDRVKALLEIENKDLALSYLVDVRNILVDLPEKEHLSWENIF